MERNFRRETRKGQMKRMEGLAHYPGIGLLARLRRPTRRDHQSPGVPLKRRPVLIARDHRRTLE